MAVIRSVNRALNPFTAKKKVYIFMRMLQGTRVPINSSQYVARVCATIRIKSSFYCYTAPLRYVWARILCIIRIVRMTLKFSTFQSTLHAILHAFFYWDRTNKKLILILGETIVAASSTLKWLTNTQTSFLMIIIYRRGMYWNTLPSNRRRISREV